MTLVLYVEYYYQAEEETTIDYPGAPAHWEVNIVEHQGVMINSFIEQADLWDDLLEAVTEQVKEKEGEL